MRRRKTLRRWMLSPHHPMNVKARKYNQYFEASKPKIGKVIERTAKRTKCHCNSGLGSTLKTPKPKSKTRCLPTTEKAFCKTSVSKNAPRCPNRFALVFKCFQRFCSKAKTNMRLKVIARRQGLLSPNSANHFSCFSFWDTTGLFTEWC